MAGKNLQGVWFLYVVECRDKTLYTGIAKDVARRIKEHNATARCRYTRSRKPVKLVYWEKCRDCSTARKREYEVKSLSREQKRALVDSKKIQK